MFERADGRIWLMGGRDMKDSVAGDEATINNIVTMMVWSDMMTWSNWWRQETTLLTSLILLWWTMMLTMTMMMLKQMKREHELYCIHNHNRLSRDKSISIIFTRINKPVFKLVNVLEFTRRDSSSSDSDTSSFRLSICLSLGYGFS